MTEATGPVDVDGAQGVRVWDPLVRLFHWVTVLCFTGAFLFEKPRDLHEALGYTVAGALAIRVIWGFIGTRHARFGDFVPKPSTFFGYIGAALRGRERRYLGHNPAGGAMVVALMVMLATVTLTGWLQTTDAFWGVDWVEEVHEAAANLTLGLVCLHIAGVVLESLRHGENLVKAMITGVKRS
ncbi:MAG: cytochrome b/b6 domain-containing protein [Rhodobacteraceae bacterium]|nr:cytochrome b/b6 domain-containing protein [Paracoccaceae bacterium]